MHICLHPTRTIPVSTITTVHHLPRYRCCSSALRYKRPTPSARQVLGYNLGKKGLVELTPLAFMILMAAAGGCPGVNIVLSTMGQFVPRLTKTFVSA